MHNWLIFFEGKFLLLFSNLPFHGIIMKQPYYVVIEKIDGKSFEKPGELQYQNSSSEIISDRCEMFC